MVNYNQNRQPDRISAGAMAGAGAIAGIIAGAVMGGVGMAWMGAAGMGAGLPIRNIAASWEGVDALVGGGGTIFVGWLTHLGVSAIMGIIFAGFIHNRIRSAGRAVGAGLIYSIAVWAVMTWALLDWANPTMYNRVTMILGTWFVLHLIFGTMLFTTPGLMRAFAKGRKSENWIPGTKAA